MLRCVKITEALTPVFNLLKIESVSKQADCSALASQCGIEGRRALQTANKK
jgi:hypothetical protein